MNATLRPCPQIALPWLAGLLAGRSVADAPAPQWQLIEVGSGDESLFRQAHIPGATWLDITRLEQAPLWNKVPDAQLLHVLLEHGLCSTSSVILYSRTMTAAARVGHLLLYAGVKDVRLLDGNLASWRTAGLPLTAGPSRRHVPVATFGSPFPAHPDYLIDTYQAKALMTQADGTLASIRSHAEFIGATSGYSYIPVCGEIPGACWGRAGVSGDINSMSDFQHPDGRMKSPAAISAFWSENGIVPTRQTAFYCGTGWRASLAFFYARAMGWPRISVYDGGWFEWSSDPVNPRVSMLQSSAESTVRTPPRSAALLHESAHTTA
ncbi:sulfurtransferase [Actimicrobium antarcticum]